MSPSTEFMLGALEVMAPNRNTALFWYYLILNGNAVGNPGTPCMVPYTQEAETRAELFP